MRIESARRAAFLTTLALVAAYLPLSEGRASAATFTPACPGGVGDVSALVAAMTNANSTPGANAIVLAANCTYTMETVSDTSFGAEALLPITSNALTIQGNGAVFVRDTNAPAMRFFVVNGGVLSLLDLTLRGGMTDSTASVDDGGAILVEAGELAVAQVTFESNVVPLSSSGGGGAVAVESGATAVIVQSTALANSAPQGGGFYCNGGTLEVANSTLTSNLAQTIGGAVALTAGTATLVNATVGNNEADTSGSGIAQVAGTFSLTNTIVANNGGATPTNLDTDGTFTDEGYNLIGATSAHFDGTTIAGVFGASVQPRLGQLAANGGPTQTMALLAGSPAIGAASGAACAASPVGGVDQRGVARPSSGCDIGAYEATVDSADAGSDAGSIDAGGTDGGFADGGGSDGGAIDGGATDSGDTDGEDAIADSGWTGDAANAIDAASVADGGATTADGSAARDSGMVIGVNTSVDSGVISGVDASTVPGADASVAASIEAGADGGEDGGAQVAAGDESSSGCGCRTVRGEPAGGLVVALYGVALLAHRRRRRATS